MGWALEAKDELSRVLAIFVQEKGTLWTHSAA